MGFNPFKVFKKKSEGAVIDLTRTRKTGTVTNVTAQGSQTTDDAGLGFIGSLASAADTNATSTTNSAMADDSFRSNSTERIERFGRRIDRVLQRIELLERKLERVEHRLDIG